MVVVAGVTACGSDSKLSSAPTAQDINASGKESGQAIAGDQQINAASAPAATLPAGDPPSGAPTEIPDVTLLAIDVTYGLLVDDITAGIDAVSALAERNGGQIYDRSINITGDRSATASFVIKLPPANIDQAINELNRVGKLSSAGGGAEDVTAQSVDIDARLSSAEASLARVRKLLESSVDLGQIISLEGELTTRETAVEQLQAQKRSLGKRVALATLRVNLTLTPEAAAAPTTVTAEKQTIGKAFRSGWKGFVNVLAAIVIFIGYTAPFLVLMLVAAAVLIPFSRRRRLQRELGQQSRSAAPPPPPTPAEDQQTSERDSVGSARSR
jgi:hypothetical protein